MQSQEEERGLDDEPEDEGKSGNVYELSQYNDFVRKLHYDPDDNIDASTNRSLENGVRLI